MQPDSTTADSGTLTFHIEAPSFDAVTGIARFAYGLGDLTFVETLTFPDGFDQSAADKPAFARLLGMTALVLGTSYFKLRAPFTISAPELALTQTERDFALDVYENGLGEFYARNELRRFGRLKIDTPERTETDAAPVELADRTLLPIGGGKDSLVSVQLFEKAGEAFTPFAVNPKGPILTSVNAIGAPALYVSRSLDPEMIRLGEQPGYFNGHVPSTAINSMIAALTAVLFGYSRIALSNERSASEGNVEFDGREANHQHSKSFSFEQSMSRVLNEVTGGALTYFSALRPYSEAKIARLFTRESRFDAVFSSCNRNFRLAGHKGELWCGVCPKCHFTFLMLAPHMPKDRLIAIFGANLLDKADNTPAFRELTGLAGQKPWECVGEILEAAACLHTLSKRPEWAGDAVIAALRDDLLSHYGEDALRSAYDALFVDAHDHLIPSPLAQRLFAHAD